MVSLEAVTSVTITPIEDDVACADAMDDAV